MPENGDQNARWRALLGSLMGVAIWLAPGPAHADREFDPEGVSWSGLSEFVASTRAAGFDVRLPQRLDLAEAGTHSALLIVHPTRALPAAALSRFMRAGGRVALADDFGDGEAFLRGYKIGRRDPVTVDHTRRLRGNRNVVIAQPRGGHPLTRDVLALVANHPTALQHHELEAVYSLEAGSALVLAGGVGEGRLVAIADSSIFINNMMEFRGNRTFALNLAAFLTEDGSRPLYLVHDGAVISGLADPGGPGSTLAAMKEGLRGLADAELPPAAVTLCTLVIGLLLLLFAFSALPLQTAFAQGLLLRNPGVAAGFAGRLSLYETRGENLFYPLLTYKQELETHLVDALGLSGQPGLKLVVAQMQRAGLPAPVTENARQLLIELDALHAQRDRGPSPPRVGERRFSTLIRRGEQLVEALDSPRTR